MQITAFANVYCMYRYWLMANPNSLLPVPAWTLVCLWVIAPVRAALNHLCNATTVIPVIKLVSDGLRGWVHFWSSYVYYWPQHSYPSCNTHSGCYTADWWYECCIDTEVQRSTACNLKIWQGITRVTWIVKWVVNLMIHLHLTTVGGKYLNKSIWKNVHPWIFIHLQINLYLYKIFYIFTNCHCIANMNHCKYSRYICKSNCTHIFSGNIFIDKSLVSVAISLKYDFFLWLDNNDQIHCDAMHCLEGIYYLFYNVN